MRSFNFKTVLNDVSQLKHIQLTKHMHYCIQRIYHMYYTTQWIFIICSKFSHMTLTSANKNEFIRLVATIRRFWLFLLWSREFPFNVVGNFEPKKITSNFNALAKSIIIHYFLSWSRLLSICFSWQCKTMLITKTTCSDVIGACA